MNKLIKTKIYIIGLYYLRDSLFSFTIIIIIIIKFSFRSLLLRVNNS